MKTDKKPLFLFFGIILINYVILPSAYAGDFTAIHEELRTEYSDITMINVDDAYDMLHNSAEQNSAITLLDVRARKEYAVSHIQGAHNAVSLRYAKKILAGVDKSQPIVVYCATGYRSGDMTRLLQREGYTNVVNVEGSIFEWVDKDYPVYQNDKQVKKVHPVDRNNGKYLRKDYHSYSP